MKLRYVSLSPAFGMHQYAADLANNYGHLLRRSITHLWYAAVHSRSGQRPRSDHFIIVQLAQLALIAFSAGMF